MICTFEIVGTTPLMLSADDVLAADAVKAWQKNPKNKDLSVPGDDRSPAWTWRTRLYTDGEFFTVPTANLLASLRQAGATITIKGNKTWKSAVAGGLLADREHLILKTNGKPIKYPAFDWKSCMAERLMEFDKELKSAEKAGFKLDVRRIPVGGKKHVRVRPTFDQWELSGQLHVVQPELKNMLSELFRIAGVHKGLCDWRPGAPKCPGPYGLFRVILLEVE